MRSQRAGEVNGAGADAADDRQVAPIRSQHGAQGVVPPERRRR